MALCGWTCAVPTLELQHNWSQLEIELCWWITETVSFSIGCQGRGLSKSSHNVSTLIWQMTDMRNFDRRTDGAFNNSTTRYLCRSIDMFPPHGRNYCWHSAHCWYTSNLQPVLATPTLHYLSTVAAWCIASAALGFSQILIGLATQRPES